MAYRYPEDIARASSDYVEFEFYKYKSPIAGATGSGSSLEVSYTTNFNLTKSDLQTCILTMPSDISTGFTGGWGGKDTTSLAQVALKTVGTALGGIASKGDVKGAIDQLYSQIGSADTYKSLGKALGDDVIKALANGFNAIPGIGSNLNASDILQLSGNAILNPNTELLYGGPSLREHSYSFKLIPRSTTEADHVVGIVEQFKKATLPPPGGAIFGTKGNNFLGIPDLVKVNYKRADGSINPYLPNYKYSGIKSVSINYITENNYMSYTDGKPLGVALSISLIEAKLIFRNEIGSGNNNYR